MALTTSQKTALGLLVLTLLGTFSFIGYKVYIIDEKDVTFKVFKDSSGSLEFGIENGTEYCTTCDRYIYLRLAKKINGSSSVIIPNSEYKKLLKIDLYQGETQEPVNFPYKVYYKSGSSWILYPPKTASLTLSTTSPKYFKVVAVLPKDTGVSGNVGISVMINGNQISVEEDPIWWINGNPVNIEPLCNNITKTKTINVNVFTNVTEQYTCPTIYFNSSNRVGYCYSAPYVNSTDGKTYQSLLFSHSFDRGFAANRTIYWNLNYFNYSYLEFINMTRCDVVGFIVGERVYNLSLCDLKCNIDTEFSCDVCSVTNCNGEKDDGEQAAFSFPFDDGLRQNMKNFKIKYSNVLNVRLRDCVEKA